jgi:ABC-type Fe3+/spermidine/putrescine transport system ATPase subunit
LLQKRLNVTVLFVTHDQLEALSLSDTIAVMNLGCVEQVGAPRVLYEAPISPFVRDFLGQNLLLSGHVRESLDNERAVVAVHESEIEGRAAPGWRSVAGAAVKLAIRPEDIELLPPGTSRDRNVLVARTRSALFLGDRYQVTVELANGAELLLQTPRARTDWEPDQQVSVYLPPEAVTLWPA